MSSSSSSNLLSLPTELRLQILDHLFISCLPTTKEESRSLYCNSQWSPICSSPRFFNETWSAYAPPPPSRWLKRIRLYIDHDRVTLDPIAGGKYMLPELKTERKEHDDEARQGYCGIFATCKTLREEALQLWFDEYVVFEVREHSRRAAWFERQTEHRRASKSFRRQKAFARPAAVAMLGHRVGVGVEEQGGGILQRVRNCEVFLEVHDESEMQETPGRLRLLMESLSMERMKYFRVSFRFLYSTFGERSRRHFGRRQCWSAIGKQPVGEDTWTMFMEQVGRLNMKQFCGKEEGSNEEGWQGGRWHVVFVDCNWECGEGGFARFEALAGLIGAVVESDDDGRLVDGLPESRGKW